MKTMKTKTLRKKAKKAMGATGAKPTMAPYEEGEDESAVTSVWKRPGYKVVMFRAREEVIELLDEMVADRNKRSAIDTIGEPVVTRTTLLLEALRAMFMLASGDLVGGRRIAAEDQLSLRGVK